MASYTVKPGDSWESIADSVYGAHTRMFGELMRANGGGFQLRPGEVINLPQKVENPFISNELAASMGMATSGQIAEAYRTGTASQNVRMPWTEAQAQQNMLDAQSAFAMSKGITPLQVGGGGVAGARGEPIRAIIGNTPRSTVGNFLYAAESRHNNQDLGVQAVSSVPGNRRDRNRITTTPGTPATRPNGTLGYYETPAAPQRSRSMNGTLGYYGPPTMPEALGAYVDSLFPISQQIHGIQPTGPIEPGIALWKSIFETQAKVFEMQYEADKIYTNPMKDEVITPYNPAQTPSAGASTLGNESDYVQFSEPQPIGVSVADVLAEYSGAGIDWMAIRAAANIMPYGYTRQSGSSSDYNQNYNNPYAPEPTAANQYGPNGIQVMRMEP